MSNYQVIFIGSCILAHAGQGWGVLGFILGGAALNLMIRDETTGDEPV